jgi:hypothetical protein
MPYLLLRSPKESSNLPSQCFGGQEKETFSESLRAEKWALLRAMHWDVWEKYFVITGKDRIKA